MTYVSVKRVTRRARRNRGFGRGSGPPENTRRDKAQLGAEREPCRVALFFLTALTCITAFRSVGVLVVLALLIGPYLTARLFCQRLGQLLLWTPVLGITACLIAVAASRSLLSTTGVPLSTAGILSVVIGLQFAVAATLKTLSTRRKICDTKIG